MSQTFVFIGSLSETMAVGKGAPRSVRLTEYGQRVELDDQIAAECDEAGGLVAIPAADFDALGFDPKDLKKFKKVSSHERAPAEFLEKKRQAAMILHERREAKAAGLQTNATVEPPAPPPAAPEPPAIAPAVATLLALAVLGASAFFGRLHAWGSALALLVGLGMMGMGTVFTVSSRKRRFFVTAEATFATAVAPTNTSCVLMEDLKIMPVQGEILRPDLTGDDGELVGTPGRRSCTWESSLSIAGSGVAGTPPDCDKMLVAALGAAHVIVASTSVTYPLGSTISSINPWSYVTNPTDATNQVALGAIIDQTEIVLGADAPMFKFKGEAFWGPDTDEFTDSGMDMVAKGGLSSFPAIPSSPTTNGTPCPGYKLTVTLDSNGFTSAKSTTITLKHNRELPKDAVGGYPAGPADGLRAVTFDISIYDDDSPAIQDLKVKGKNKTTIACTFVQGTVAGNILTVPLRNVMLGIPEYDTSAKRRVVTFKSCRAHDTSIGSGDSVSLAFT